MWLKMYIGLHVKYPLFLSDFNENWIFSKILDRYSYIKFHENPSIGSQYVPCEQMDGRTYMTKLIVTSHNIANAPKNYVVCVQSDIRNIILQRCYKTNTTISAPCNVTT